MVLILSFAIFGMVNSILVQNPHGCSMGEPNRCGGGNSTKPWMMLMEDLARCCGSGNHCCGDNGPCCPNELRCCPGDAGNKAKFCCKEGEVCCSDGCCPSGRCMINGKCVPS